MDVGTMDSSKHKEEAGLIEMTEDILWSSHCKKPTHMIYEVVRIARQRARVESSATPDACSPPRASPPCRYSDYLLLVVSIDP